MPLLGTSDTGQSGPLGQSGVLNPIDPRNTQQPSCHGVIARVKGTGIVSTSPLTPKVGPGSGVETGPIYMPFHALNRLSPDFTNIIGLISP